MGCWPPISFGQLLNGSSVKCLLGNISHVKLNTKITYGCCWWLGTYLGPGYLQPTHWHKQVRISLFGGKIFIVSLQCCLFGKLIISVMSWYYVSMVVHFRKQVSERLLVCRFDVIESILCLYIHIFQNVFIICKSFRFGDPSILDFDIQQVESLYIFHEWAWKYPCLGLVLLMWVYCIPSMDRHLYIHHKMWDEITYPFPNFTFILQFTWYVITYPCRY